MAPAPPPAGSSGRTPGGYDTIANRRGAVHMTAPAAAAAAALRHRAPAVGIARAAPELPPGTPAAGLFEDRGGAHSVTLEGCQIVAGGRAQHDPRKRGWHAMHPGGVPEPDFQTALIGPGPDLTPPHREANLDYSRSADASLTIHVRRNVLRRKFRRASRCAACSRSALSKRPQAPRVEARRVACSRAAVRRVKRSG